MHIVNDGNLKVSQENSIPIKVKDAFCANLISEFFHRVTLDHRKLMYHNDQLDAYPKGEIFLGSCHEFPFKSQEELEHAAASVGVKDVKDLYAFGSYKISLGGFGLDKLDPSRHGFSLHTPYRFVTYQTNEYIS
jgi:hypothetical protein